MDSDGDGFSNGAELGDPKCVWIPGSEPDGTPTGHPGICEPLRDSKCLSINKWYTCEKRDLECDAINSPDVQEFEIKLPKTKVPVRATTFTCTNFAFPSDKDYHIIADRSSIDNHNVMHHIIIYGCPNEVENLIHPLNTQYDCLGEMGEQECVEQISMWTIGKPGLCLYEKAGFKIGATGYKYATMQVHWNNPGLKDSYEDSSGMILYYTPLLRQYNLGSLLTGEKRFSIPPGNSSYVVNSECTPVCSAKIMNSPIYVVSGFNHMHKLGRAMTLSQRSPGLEERILTHDSHYSFGNPVVHAFDPPIEIKPGDELRTKCTFDSSRKSTVTYQGDGALDEMCNSFVIYYPKESLWISECMSYQGLPMCSLRDLAAFIDKRLNEE
ncbi:Tyramine beta-hydroxylase [Mizuhopecten yessoensis]|uniref:Tyramine beta-hydroxylase n=2 Tax=Mizuhopecten yessoensis TaxID=6573 RepID=A0A210PMN6_MIZYE|nr:Tyramine beta-hydroxylase [Mizuhopecten yessoensis]